MIGPFEGYELIRLMNSPNAKILYHYLRAGLMEGRFSEKLMRIIPLLVNFIIKVEPQDAKD